MNLNIALDQEQQQRLQEGLTASQEQIHNEARKNTDLYSAGDFDGFVEVEPDSEKWGEYAYRDGFLTGLTRYYDQKYQVSLANEPF